MSKTVFNWRTLLLAFIVLAVMNMFLKSCKKSYLEGDAAPTPSIDATKKELEKYLFEKKEHISKLRTNILGRFKVITPDQATLKKVEEHITRNDYDGLVMILNSL